MKTPYMVKGEDGPQQKTKRNRLLSNFQIRKFPRKTGRCLQRSKVNKSRNTGCMYFPWLLEFSKLFVAFLNNNILSLNQNK